MKKVNFDSPLITIQRLSEEKLTMEILIPLFNTLGFNKVDYHGGPYEGGKDLILWRKDEIGLVELAVAQVKKYKFSAKAADTRSFAEVVNQLLPAMETPVPHIDGIKYRPSIVYFITPFEIETRALQTRFEKYSELRSHRLKIIDGPFLVDLINQKLPKLAARFFGIRETIGKITAGKLNNQTLLDALESKNYKNIKSLYSDLEITFGSISFNYFIYMDIKECDPILFIKDIEWSMLKEICIEAQSKYNLSILGEPISNVDKGFSKNYFTDPLEEESTEKKPPLAVQIRLNLHEISKFMIEQKKWLLEIRSTLNSPTLSIEECRRILLDCHEMFSFFHKILKNKTLYKFFIERGSNGVENEYRLTIPINTLFDTGLNFSILGEPGAGKTTTLQIQAQRLLSDSRTKELILYLPLARVFNAFRKKSKAPTNRRIQLFDAIFEYFRSEGEDITETALADTLEKTNSIIMLDGIDEIINIEPAILEEIEILGGRFPKSQLIFSARTGGAYLNESSFLGIKLLPFTDEQRDNFFINWFDDPEDEKVLLIQKHLKGFNHLSEIVRSPLLATILCVLAEHEIQLPENEIRLYEERIHLLIGHYDLHKQTSRLTSTKKNLETIIRKLAYHFHHEKIREMEYNEVVDYITSTATPSIPSDKAIIAINELIHPCDLLVPMSKSNSFGFGHFRYQEYLAALELCNNRNINIGRFLSEEWWRGVLILYSQMIENIDFLIQYAISEKIVIYAMPTINQILLIRPSVEQMKYQKTLEEAINSEEDLLTNSSQR